MRCGFAWEAPRQPTPGQPVGLYRDGRAVVANERTAHQTCCLPKGHEGDHRSSTNVTIERT